ncbi:GTP 3',8-cyclase MoaA [Bacillus cihuensis]|uniref:GTP 3',8-cyclase MoaA n=1 Tax=Bacillus cihuensis TaxID=1208599 RepID=UPI00048BD222|nr:GTP 3',8-cyclase MoaA [Bacillus cihuensis]
MMKQPLTDTLSRPLRDLRISVTDRCNFRCTYCMPKEVFGDKYVFLPKSELLTFEEMTRLASIFVQMGVKKIRLTGGEPLLRNGLPEFIKMLRKLEGLKDIGLTTNGLLLNKYGKALYEAGLRRLNISLDALSKDIFSKMNGRGINPGLILENIEYVKSLGFSVKVNMVVQRGVNEQEVIPMSAYFKEKHITLRFIEFMDVGNDNDWSFQKVVSKKEILSELLNQYQLIPVDANYFGEVAERYRYENSDSEIGFIPSVSKSFCSSCTRARLSSDGKLYTCLFASNGYDLRQLLRENATNNELSNAIWQVWNNRTDRYSDERTDLQAISRKKIGMSYIGG